MRKILGKMFSHKNSSVVSTLQELKIPYPPDYRLKCSEVITGLRASKGDYDSVLETGAEDLFLKSIQWINDGVEVDLVSLLKLIKTIKKFVPADSWIESNAFRVHYDVDIKNRDFILDQKNSDFLLTLVSLGEDGHHFACNLLVEFKEELALTFIADLLDVLTQDAEVFECEHWQRTPVLGSPFIELIRTHRLSTAQLARIYEYVTSEKSAVSQYLISTIELYLSNNPLTPLGLLKKFAKNQDAVWAWVTVTNPAQHLEVIGNEAFIEVIVGEYAQRALSSR
jgi:hypothetical protein